MVKMDGNQRSIIALCGLLGVSLLQNQACETSDNPSTMLENAGTVTSLLAGVGPNVVVPTLQQFSEELEALYGLLGDLQAELESGGDSAALHADVQQQWLDTMLVWQQLEVMQVGPAGSSLKFVAGQDIRDEIYSWPTVNACRIDQKTADESWKQAGFFDDNLVNAYGLDGIERLLFGEDDTVCPSQVKPNSDGSWSALGPDGVALNRIQFALVLVEELQRQNDQLERIWSATGSDFSSQLGTIDDNSPYASEDEALNQVYNALFYLETATKDKKLAIPLGYKECTEDICPDRLEGLASDSSLEAIEANLEGFRLLFTGGEGVGFDDLLTEMGHGDLTDQVLNDIEATLSLAEAMEESLDVALQNDFAGVEAFHDSLALVTSALKYDVATILNVEIPVEASGDND